MINRNNLFFFINLPKYYGSIILTFLGAVYWGIILNDSHKNLISEKIKTYIICWSIIPSMSSGLILIFSHHITIIILAKMKIKQYVSRVNYDLDNIFTVVKTYLLISSSSIIASITS